MSMCALLYGSESRTAVCAGAGSTIHMISVLLCTRPAEMLTAKMLKSEQSVSHCNPVGAASSRTKAPTQKAECLLKAPKSSIPAHSINACNYESDASDAIDESDESDANLHSHSASV